MNEGIFMYETKKISNHFTNFQLSYPFNTKRIHQIYLFMPNGACIFNYSFLLDSRIEAQLVSGSLSGFLMLIKEVTQNKTNIKMVEQEEIFIIFEYGNYLSGALITENNLINFRQKLTRLIKEVECFYYEELINFDGNISPFTSINYIIRDLFPLN